MPRTCELFVLSRAGLLPFGACGLPLVLVEGDEVECVPVAVHFVCEGSFCEEARLVLVFALHVEALRVRVCVVPFLGFIYPCAFDGAGVLVVAHVDIAGVLAVGVGHVHGGSVRERDVVHGRVGVVGKLLANETLVKERFMLRKATVGTQCVNGFIVVHSYRFLSVSCLRVLVAVYRFVYVDGGRVPVVIEGADVVFLHISVFVGDGDGECNGHVVAERACLVAEARAVNVLLKRSHGFVSVDDATAAVGDGECSSACETQRIVGTSDDSLACEEVVDLLVCELVGAVGNNGELHDWCPFIMLCCLVVIVAHAGAPSARCRNVKRTLGVAVHRASVLSLLER